MNGRILMHSSVVLYLTDSHRARAVPSASHVTEASYGKRSLKRTHMIPRPAFVYIE